MKPILAAALHLTCAIAWGDAAWASEPARPPWIKQKASNECGRAVLASLAARRNGDVEAFYSRLPPPARPQGYTLDELRMNGARVGLLLWAVAPPTALEGCDEPKDSRWVKEHFSNLAKAIKSGDPVVILKKADPASGHYMILVEAVDAGFLAHDPAEEGLRAATTSSLAADMCASGFAAHVVCDIADRDCLSRHKIPLP